MDESSSSDGGKPTLGPSAASILGIKGNLHFRPHGSSQKAHIMLRRAEVLNDTNEDGETRTLIFFSLFAQKRIEVKPGKEILLSVMSEDGTLGDHPVVLGGVMAKEEDSNEVPEAQLDIPDPPVPLVETVVIPPKIRRNWKKRIEKPVLSNDLNRLVYSTVGVQARPDLTSVSTQTPHISRESSTQADKNTQSVSAQTEPSLPPPTVQMVILKAPSYNSTGSQTEFGEQPTVYHRPVSPKLSVSDIASNRERSLSPMELDSPSSTPPQSPSLAPTPSAKNTPMSLSLSPLSSTASSINFKVEEIATAMKPLEPHSTLPTPPTSSFSPTLSDDSRPGEPLFRAFSTLDLNSATNGVRPKPPTLNLPHKPVTILSSLRHHPLPSRSDPTSFRDKDSNARTRVLPMRRTSLNDRLESKPPATLPRSKNPPESRKPDLEENRKVLAGEAQPPLSPQKLTYPPPLEDNGSASSSKATLTEPRLNATKTAGLEPLSPVQETMARPINAPAPAQKPRALLPGFVRASSSPWNNLASVDIPGAPSPSSLGPKSRGESAVKVENPRDTNSITPAEASVSTLPGSSKRVRRRVFAENADVRHSVSREDNQPPHSIKIEPDIAPPVISVNTPTKAKQQPIKLSTLPPRPSALPPNLSGKAPPLAPRSQLSTKPQVSPLSPVLTLQPSSALSPRGTKRPGSPIQKRIFKKLKIVTVSDYVHSVKLRGDVAIHGISFCSDGTLFALSCSDQSVRIWSNLTHAEVANLCHVSPIVSAVWSEGNRAIISLSEDGLINRWTRTGQNQWQWMKLIQSGCERKPGEDNLCLAFRDDRIALSSPKFGVKVWLLTRGTWQPQRSILRQNVTCIRFVEDGEALLGGTKDGVLWYCQVPSGTLRAYSFLKTKIISIDVDASEQHALVSQVGGRSHLVVIKHHDSNKGKVVSAYTNEYFSSQSLEFGASFASKGTAVLFGYEEGCLLVWDSKPSGGLKLGLDQGDDDDPIQAAANFDGNSAAGDGYVVTGTKHGRLTWWKQPSMLAIALNELMAISFH